MIITEIANSPGSPTSANTSMSRSPSAVTICWACTCLSARELVAQGRGAFVLQRLGRLLHGAREFGVHFVVAPFEHLHGGGDVARIVLARDELHAGRRAAADLVLQAGPAAVLEEGVAAVPDAEDLLHALQRLLDGAGARERPEIPARQVARARGRTPGADTRVPTVDRCTGKLLSSRSTML